MKYLLENTKYIVLLAVVSTLAASVSVFVWATAQLVEIIYNIFTNLTNPSMIQAAGETVAVLDSYILGIILYIFSLAIYELFIGELNLPDWLIIKNLDDLKKKISSVIILMLAVTFLEHLIHWDNAQETLMFALSVAAVGGVLLFYIRDGERESKK